MVDGMVSGWDDLKRARKTIDRAEERFWTALDRNIAEGRRALPK
mgnify:CR=1 FL=1